MLLTFLIVLPYHTTPGVDPTPVPDPATALLEADVNLP